MLLTLFIHLIDQWMVVMSTQLIGFSIGGICRPFLVQPPSMSTLLKKNIRRIFSFNSCFSLTCQPRHLRSFQHTSYAGIGNRGGISRERFFFYALAASTAWCTPNIIVHHSQRSTNCSFDPHRLRPWLSFPSLVLFLLGLLDSS